MANLAKRVSSEADMMMRQGVMAGGRPMPMRPGMDELQAMMEGLTDEERAAMIEIMKRMKAKKMPGGAASMMAGMV